MTPETTLYLHIGLPKTGTTFLQDRVFPLLPSTAFLCKPRGEVVQGHPGPGYGLLDRCFKRSARIWEEYGESIFADLLARLEPGGDRERLLISDEGIGTMGRKPLFLRTHLQELSRHAPGWGLGPVRVICSFRRQDQWLGSHFAQVSNRTGAATQADFERFVEAFLDPGRDYFWDGIMLDFQTLREGVVGGVGAENVLMLPYETLAEEPTEYLAAVLDFMGLDPECEALTEALAQQSRGERRNARTVGSDRWALRTPKSELGRRVGRAPRRVLEAIGLPTRAHGAREEPPGRREIRMTEALRSRILSRYAESNASLAEDLGLDLRRYAYH